MRELSILVNTEMVLAILEGRKKMTRRVVRPQPDLSAMRWNGERWERCYGYPAGHDGMEHECPYQPGDRLWVRVERLREITEEDARAEGVGDTARERAAQDRAGGKDTAFSYRAAFARLWDGIYAGRGFGWDADPWVWVIGFRVAEVRR